MQQRDEDELWLEIVANYGDRVLDDAPDDPGVEESRPDEAGYDDPARTDPDAPSDPDAARGKTHRDDAGNDEADRGTTGPEGINRGETSPGAEHGGPPPDLFAVWADEGRFVPPPPPKMPLPEPPRLLAWLGVFGAPAILLIVVVLGIYVPPLLKFGLLGWFLGGFGYLVMTMPQEPRDPGDDGARI